jgi:hypothetical protein
MERKIHFHIKNHFIFYFINNASQREKNNENGEEEENSCLEKQQNFIYLHDSSHAPRECEKNASKQIYQCHIFLIFSKDFPYQKMNVFPFMHIECEKCIGNLFFFKKLFPQ